jgi:hypothetical protein
MSRLPGSDNYDPFAVLLPARTPGSLGRNDAGDLDAKSQLGDTPGTLGVNDGAGKIAFGWGSSKSTPNVWARPDLHGLQPIGQPLSSLCWLTCYRMLYIWKGLDPNTMEGKLRSGGLDFDAACKRGLLPDEMLGAARSLGLSSYATGSGISVVDLKAHLVFSPLWVAGEWFQNALHARLVIGANDDWVEYFDPWYGGTYGMDLQHKDLAEGFLHGDRNTARGMDKLAGKYQLSFWRS